MNHPTTPASITAILLLPLASLLADPAIGTPRDDVLRELGKPVAAFGTTEREVMMFSRGKVILENGLVSKVDLKSPAQYALEERRRLEDEQRRLEETALRLENQRRAAVAFAERKKIGDAELAKLVNTPEWIRYTGDERLEMLARLAKKHPEADLTLELQFAKAKRERENADRDRIKNLETRLAEAERRAAEAEARATEATRIAARAETRAAEAERTQTVYLPAPIVTRVYDHECAPHRTVLNIGNATITTGNPPCPPCPPAQPASGNVGGRPAPTPAKPDPRSTPAPVPKPPSKPKDKDRPVP